MPGLKTGPTYYQAQLGLPYKGCAIKRMEPRAKRSGPSVVINRPKKYEYSLKLVMFLEAQLLFN